MNKLITIAIHLLLLLRVYDTAIIKITTDFKDWNTKDCTKTQTRKTNTSWTLNTCRKSIGKTFCKFASNLLTLNNVNEIIVSFRANISRNSQPLSLQAIRQINELDFNQQYVHVIDKTYITGRRAYEERKIKWRINVENYRGIILEFHDFGGFCGTIDEFQIYYRTCDQDENDLVVDGPSNEGPFTTKFFSAPSIKRDKNNITARCKPNAVQVTETLYKTCDWLGKTTVYGECACIPGYERRNNSCILCSEGTFKADTGDHKCVTCGSNTTSTPDRKKCACVDGFFRELVNTDNYATACYDARPQNLQFMDITYESVNITWSYETKLLETGNYTFVVQCLNCDGDFQIQTTQQSVHIHHLMPDRKYTISVIVDFKNILLPRLSIEDSFRTSKSLVKTTPRAVEDRASILTITVCVALLILVIVVLVTLYVIQKRKTSHFLNRINSLKKSRRPPPPPVSKTPTTFEGEVFDGLQDNALDYEGDVDDGINPYAIFVPPKIQHLDTDDESTEDYNFSMNEQFLTPDQHAIYGRKTIYDRFTPTNRIEEDTEGYVCMSAELKKKQALLLTQKQNFYKDTELLNALDAFIPYEARTKRASNHYTNPIPQFGRYQRPDPRLLPCPPIHKIRTRNCLMHRESSQVNLSSNYHGNMFPQQNFDYGPRVRTQSCLMVATPQNMGQLPKINHDGVQLRADPMRDGDRRSRAQSCLFKDIPGYELTFQQIEKAKLNNRYKSKECLAKGYVAIRRVHSADDLSKLLDI